MTATNLPALIQGPDGVFRADSRDVAERFGKRHDNVLRAIDELVSGLRASGQPVEIIALNFEAFKINDLTGASTSHYLMDRNSHSRASSEWSASGGHSRARSSWQGRCESHDRADSDRNRHSRAASERDR